MICNNYLSHIGLNGSTPQTRVTAQGYTATLLFENLFALSPANGGNPLAAFNWWMNDPAQRAEILNSDTTDIGIAYVTSARQPARRLLRVALPQNPSQITHPHVKYCSCCGKITPPDKP